MTLVPRKVWNELIFEEKFPKLKDYFKFRLERPIQKEHIREIFTPEDIEQFCLSKQKVKEVIEKLRLARCEGKCELGGNALDCCDEISITSLGEGLGLLE